MRKIRVLFSLLMMRNMDTRYTSVSMMRTTAYFMISNRNFVFIHLLVHQVKMLFFFKLNLISLCFLA